MGVWILRLGFLLEVQGGLTQEVNWWGNRGYCIDSRAQK